MRAGRVLGACLLLAASAAAWLGCDQIFGLEDPITVYPSDGAARDSASENDATTRDAGPDTRQGDASGGGDDGDAGGGGDSVADSGYVPVTGKQIVYWVSDLTTTPLPTDFSGGIDAYVLDASADGGVVVYHGGAGAAGAGTFEIDGVPMGAEYYLVFPDYNGSGQDVYVFTTERSLDLSYYYAGRTNVVVSDAGADAPANAVTGAYDYDLYGVPGGAYGYPTLSTYTQGAAGVSLNPGNAYDPLTFQPTSDASFDNDAHLWGQDPIYTGTPLVNGKAGDVTYVMLYDAIDASLGQPQIAVRGFSTNGFSTADGGGVLTGTAQPVAPPPSPDGGGMTVQWDRGSFVEYSGQISSANVPTQQDLYVQALPAADAGGPYANPPLLYEYGLGGSTATDTNVETVPITFGNPFPASWGLFVVVDMYVKSPATVAVPPDAGIDASTALYQANGDIQCAYPLPDFNGQTLQPLVGPPQMLQVNGQPAFETHANAGLQPTVTWMPPGTTAQPNQYAVGVRELVFLPNGRATATVKSYLQTTSTTLTIPPGVLQAGHTYVFAVNSIYSAGRATNQPFLLGLPYCQTNTTTGIVTP